MNIRKEKEILKIKKESVYNQIENNNRIQENIHEMIQKSKESFNNNKNNEYYNHEVETSHNLNYNQHHFIPMNANNRQEEYVGPAMKSNFEVVKEEFKPLIKDEETSKHNIGLSKGVSPKIARDTEFNDYEKHFDTLNDNNQDDSVEITHSKHGADEFHVEKNQEHYDKEEEHFNEREFNQFNVIPHHENVNTQQFERNYNKGDEMFHSSGRLSEGKNSFATPVVPHTSLASNVTNTTAVNPSEKQNNETVSAFPSSSNVNSNQFGNFPGFSRFNAFGASGHNNPYSEASFNMPTTVPNVSVPETEVHGTSEAKVSINTNSNNNRPSDNKEDFNDFFNDDFDFKNTNQHNQGAAEFNTHGFDNNWN